MSYRKHLDGTTAQTFGIGLTTAEVSFRTNSGAAEVKDNGGSFKRIGKKFKDPESFTVDSTIASTGLITLSATPEPNSEFVTLNGVPLTRNVDYTILTNNVTLNHTGDDLVVSDVVIVVFQ